MDEKIKAEWVARLRSGKYVQGIGQLRQPISPFRFSYCCLGVLTDMYCEVTGEEWDQWGAVHQEGAVLSEEVAEWAGISTDSVGWRTGTFERDGRYAELSCLNDIGYSFNEIATIIEEKF